MLHPVFPQGVPEAPMAPMEARREVLGPFAPRRNSLGRTSAEIVSEARRSLRAPSTRRPFTPRDAHRQLFGRSPAGVERDDRPPSAFSLHAQNFDAPDSRPGSGTRLSPLDHRPKLPVLCDGEEPFTGPPRPPAAPAEVRKGLTGARAARLLRAGSLASLPPVETNAEGAGQRRPSAQRLSSGDSGPRRTASESRITQPGVDSGLRPTDCRAERRTELRSADAAAAAANTDKDAESLAWNRDIGPLLQQLESVAAGLSSQGSVQRLCDLCAGLHAALAGADMLGRRCKRRSGILRTLFRLIDLNSAQLNLHIAKLCLALCVSGNNLLNICKLTFQISRSENNDVLFQNSSIIDSLLDVLSGEDVSSSGEALLYCVGTLKFLSGNFAVLRLLLDKNCIGAAQKLLQKLCAVEDTHSTMAGHILVQLTATLRNLADHPDSRPLFVSSSTLPTLCAVLRQHCEDQDICTNISRIYSKLSSYSGCRHALAQTPDCYRLFLEVLSKHHHKQDLAVRLLFTLGNLTAKCDEARLQLYRCDGCLDALLQLYRRHQRREDEPGDGGAREADDVLVKLARVLANMCIHPDVGPSLATDASCVQLLMETLELRSVQESEELLVNVAATINNLSFYREERSAVTRNQLAIAKLMEKLMVSYRMDAMLEATRVYGNLSQSKEVRDFIMQNKVHQFVLMLLNSKSAEVCFSACGVLTNLALDPPNRACLSQEGAATKLVDRLGDLGPGDWQLAGQLCQAMWNLLGGGSEEALDPRQRDALLDILVTYSDEDEALKWTENQDVRDFHKACWELEFLPVAHRLIQVLRPPDPTVN